MIHRMYSDEKKAGVYRMSAIWRTGVFVFFFLFISPVFLPAITLHMKEIVLVDRPVTLGMILTVKDAPFSLQEKIRDYALPLPGERIHILPSRYIREIITGFTAQSVIIIGKRTILIPAMYAKAWGSRFVHQFPDFLTSLLCKKDNRVAVDIISPPELGVPGPGKQYRFHILDKQEYMGFPAGTLDIEVVNNGDDEEKRTYCRIEVHHFIPVIRAASSMEPSEVLSWEKLIIIEEKLNPFMGEILKADEPVETYQTIKRVARGEILYESYVRKILQVRAGEKITIVIKKGSVLLSMNGRSADSGGNGDTVKVRPSLSTEWMTGRVTGQKEVLVEM
jgi:flagella basal body P-ring formation protein FlgA